MNPRFFEKIYNLIECSMQNIIFAKKAIQFTELNEKNKHLKTLTVNHFKNEILISEQEIQEYQQILKR
jgi:hypothetical protein